MTNNFTQKQQNLLNFLNKEIENNPHWAENIYEDEDDPHSEMLIKYVMLGVEECFPYYLNHIITQAPEHKLSVLGGFLLSGVMILYLNEQNQEYINNLLKRFPTLIQQDSFWKGFCYRISKQENLYVLFEMEQSFDPALKKCKQFADVEQQHIFTKYDLYKKLNGKLQEKNTIIKTSKI